MNNLLDFSKLDSEKSELIRPEGYVESTFFSNLGILNATSTKVLGNMSVSRDRDGTALAHFSHFMDIIGIDITKKEIGILNATHSNNIALLESVDGNEGRQTISRNSPEVREIRSFKGIFVPRSYMKTRDIGIDAAVTKDPNLMIGVLPADCAVCIFFDPITKVLGVAHAGAIGAFSKIMANTVTSMNEWFDVEPRNLYCYISPCVTKEFYKLGLSGMWPNVFKGVIEEHYAEDFDLKDFISRQLMESGIPKNQILSSQFCTLGEEDLFFSSARAKTPAEKELEGRNLSLAGIDINE
jgi:hypothetical protein